MGKHDATVVVIGGATVDIDGFVENEFVARTSNPGKIKVSSGGVGRNIAENLVRLGINTKLITALGNDTFGKQVLNECKRSGMDTQHIMLSDSFSASMYMANPFSSDYPSFDVHPDGQRFLLRQYADQSGFSELTILRDWVEMLEERK